MTCLSISDVGLGPEVRWVCPLWHEGCHVQGGVCGVCVHGEGDGLVELLCVFEGVCLSVCVRVKVCVCVRVWYSVCVHCEGDGLVRLPCVFERVCLSECVLE